MDAYRAELDMVRAELVDGQRHSDVVRAEAAQATGCLENEVFALVAKSRAAHEMQHAAQEWYDECIARLDTTFNAFEQEAEAIAQWRGHYEALRQEGHKYVATRDREAQAMHEEFRQAEADKQELASQSKIVIPK